MVPTSANSRKNVVPFLHAGLDRAHGALRDFLRIVLALEVVGDLDRFRQRAGLVRPHDLAEQALVGSGNAD